MVGQTPASTLQTPFGSLIGSFEGETSLESQDQPLTSSQPGTIPMAGSGRTGRRLQMWNCTYCRKDKKKCNRQSRTGSQKCDRCESLGLPCSEATRKNRKRKASGVNTTDAIDRGDLNAIIRNNSLTDPLLRNAHSEPTGTISESSWDFKDLSNATGMLQLVAAEYIEQEAACHAAAQRLPKHYTQPNSVLHARHQCLTSIINNFGTILHSEIMSRLKIHRDSPSKEFLEASMNVVVDPLGGIFVHPTTSPVFMPHFMSQRPPTLQSSDIAKSLQKRAVDLIADGKVSQALICHAKSAAHGHQGPNIQFSSTVRSLDVSNIMARTAVKFGLVGECASHGSWAWPSMIHPTLLPVPEANSLETVLIKNWVGFDDSIKLLGVGMIRSASPSDWRTVFRHFCRNAKTLKRAPDGYTCLHLAVLLDMGEEVSLLMETANFDLAMPDKYGYTALHLAAISGAELICDKLLVKGGDKVGILKRDSEGRTPLWYAAEKGKTKLYEKLITATSKHKPMTEICLEKDNDGQILAQYAAAYGLEQSHLMELSIWSEFPNPDHTRPELFPVPYRDWKDEISYSTGSGLSPWAQPGTSRNQ